MGVEWDAPIPQTVSALDLTMATFFDGGWFGANGVGPAAGGPLDAGTHLIAPTVQVSTDMGTTWTTVAATNNYVTALTGHRVGGGAQPNPSTTPTARFTLNAPRTGITGIRIIGEEGGAASAGFIGVFELAITVVQNGEDTDGDGMADIWETENGLIVGVDDSGEDPDGDTLTNLAEFESNTDPGKADTDDDGLNDAAEVAAGTGPRDPDSDDDGLTDGAEVNTHATNPLLADTDGDGLADENEVVTLLTNPNAADTDGDGFPDGIEVAQGTGPKDAASAPSNYALLGSGIIGTNDAVDGDEGTFYEHAGIAASVVDGDPLTRVDTYDGGGGSPVSFVGVIWPSPRPEPLGKLTLTMAVFFDGGWFGPNGDGPGTGGFLDSTFLTEPTVQITKDGGTTWTVAPHTSDYLEAFDGAALPDVDFGPPTNPTAVFTLNSPETGITGARLIGDEGGAASGGFIGVFELAVEPSAPGTPFAITGFVYNPSIAATPFTIAWNSRPGRQYTLFWGTDMISFDGEVADGIPAAGETTTFSFANPSPGLAEMYFRVAEE